MKKPIHLYIFAVLSAIASLLRLYSSFFSSFNEEQMRTALQSQGMPSDTINQFIASNKAVVDFGTNVISRGFAVILLLLLVVAIIFLFRKQVAQATYWYIGYLFGTLLLFTYNYVGLNNITGTNNIVLYLINVVFFFIYFGVTVYFLFRKPKETLNMEQNATDI